MSFELVDILESGEPLSHPAAESRLGQVLGTMMPSSQIDLQSDLLAERMTTRIGEAESGVRKAWKERWCCRDPAARQTADAEFAQWKQARDQERRRYLFGMECVLALRSKHIECLQWAIEHAEDTAATDRLLEADLCRSFSLVLPDGTEVVPYRIRHSATGMRAFKVSDAGNKNSEARLVYDEEALRRYVVVLGYRVRCKTRDGTRAGLYTAESPNRVAYAGTELLPKSAPTG